jgi:hypothetical protein
MWGDAAWPPLAVATLPTSAARRARAEGAVCLTSQLTVISNAAFRQLCMAKAMVSMRHRAGDAANRIQLAPCQKPGHRQVRSWPGDMQRCVGARGRPAGAIKKGWRRRGARHHGSVALNSSAFGLPASIIYAESFDSCTTYHGPPRQALSRPGCGGRAGCMHAPPGVAAHLPPSLCPPAPADFARPSISTVFLLLPAVRALDLTLAGARPAQLSLVF